MATSTTTAAAPPPAPAPAKPAVQRPLPVAKTKQPLATNTYIGIVAAIAALILVVCLFVGYRLLGHIVLDVKVISKEATAKSALTTKLSDANTVVNNYHNLGGSQQQLLGDALPNAADFTQLVALMDSLSSTSGVQLKSMSPTAGNGGSPAGATPPAGSTVAPTPYVFSVEVEGPYNQVVSYFRNLELSARPMRVLTSTFAGTSSDLRATLDIQTYFQGPANISDQQVTVK